MTILPVIQDGVDERVKRIRAAQPDWPCGKGCDGCCHRLAEIPQLTGAEWSLLQTGLSALLPARWQAVREGIEALAGQTSRPVVCPMLDHASGACLVYEQRPVACRTYGFYMQRGLGLYCNEIERRVDEGQWPDVVWGNHDAIDHALAALGAARPLTAWFSEWQAAPSGDDGKGG